MKNISLFFTVLLLTNAFVQAQSVTLATSTLNPTKGTVVYNNGTNILQYWNGTAWIPVINAASGTGWALNGTHLRTTNTGFVGIGIPAPEAPLSVRAEGIGISQETNGSEVRMGFYTEGSSVATVQTHTPHDLTFATGNGSPRVYIKHNSGNIGIGTPTPNNKLQIGSLGSNGFVGNQLALGNGTHAMAINQTNSVAFLGSSTDIILNPRYFSSGGGYVGINTFSPANLLQIGSMGGTGYAGNDIAFGNGSNVTGISQTNAALTIATTTDVVFRANNNTTQVGIGGGRVGINTLTPRGPLDVASYSNTAPLSVAYFFRSSSTGNPVVSSNSSYVAPISIYADNGVLSTAFVAISDARIKNIIGISSSVKDLETVKTLHITDYTMKDHLQHGTKTYKKVIAQQVEKVYPQAVTHITDVVPDIYALAEKAVFDEKNKTLQCLLEKNYELKIGEILQFIHPEKGKLKAEVIEVSDNSFTVKDWQYPTDKIFVYGREVNDFRSVDYEALSMLGISAIQQLAKENEEVRLRNNELNRKNDELNRKLEQMKSDFSARLEAIEAQLSKTPTGN
ncbi:tail fiber domain-containing protein [Emticicia agri]|nr:tail fiber domain-containing protein [Emticicia agri]